MARVERYGRLDLPVLLRGPSGSGKDLVARAIHACSGRSGAFVAINSATLTGPLAESELFGHTRGAFTGASRDREGAFRCAHRGTLFLDEVGSLSMDVQAKLLRVLEERAVRPVGGDAPVAIDVRILSATCEPLESYVLRGQFRRDLFERIALCRIPVPSLRERLEDLPDIARQLLDELGFSGVSLTHKALQMLESWPFEGNVRELKGILACAAVESGTKRIDPLSLRGILRERSALEGRVRSTRPSDEELKDWMHRTQGNVARAARHAGVARSTLRDWLKSAGLDESAPEVAEPVGAARAVRTSSPRWAAAFPDSELPDDTCAAHAGREDRKDP